MDLKSGYPYWAVKNGLMYSFPALDHDVSCDVLVVGGGITGALIARQLAAANLEVVIAEQRDIAWGSTAASTALLQYEIDTPLIDLTKKFGEPIAARIYQSCAEAILELRDISHEVGDVDFAFQQSLYFASSWMHRRWLRQELELRGRHGLEVSWLSRQDLRERFALDSSGAILSELAASVDPYRLTSRLLKRLQRSGVSVFDRTPIGQISTHSRGVVATTDQKFSIRARHVVIAAGYASEKWLDQRVACNRSSYAYVTDPIDSKTLGPWANTLAWESAHPYLYMRSTVDRRLIIGGEDDAIDIPARRDTRVARKIACLRKRVGAFLDDSVLEPAFAWAGTFAETPDGLPFFGAHVQHGSRVLFAMAYGGNGITYSAIGAELILRAIQKRKHPLAKIFGFGRLN